ncbi:MAG TPA: BTAD domain-containing putative transcriptional regulator [Burkholderiaceae bacterium]|nr:BTAD domain-containing putative transcriptional regulator [Burkholderiaceae bacterium]
MKSEETARAADDPAIEVRLLGPMSVVRDGQPVELPPSRKARALLAYLMLTPHAVARSSLCELLWDGPDDPRAELRWCLSRIRGILGGSRRLVAREDTVRVDVSGCTVDATALDEALEEGVNGLDVARCRTLVALVGGDFLQGLEIEGSPHFSAWLTARRHHFRDRHAELLERLATAGGEDEAVRYLEQWRQLAPYDPKVHQMLLNALARRGRVREAEEHLRAAVRLFEDEGLDSGPLHTAWRAARSLAAPLSGGIEILPAADAGGQRESAGGAASRRASIAVMPFVEQSTASEVPGGTADALAHDVITRLAKLRSLFVIAQGTVFELKARGIGPAEAARMLNVDYVISGSVRRDGALLTVTVELIEVPAGRVVWTDVLKQRPADALLVLDEIGNRIVASIASEIEALERNRAVLKPPNSLDAWESHHRGLWHMYRFSKADNELARQFFEGAVQLDRTFSRAYAGLSFTHFQSAFQGWAERAPAVERAYEAAGQSLMADDRDPAAHWAMGRALWLRSRHDQCVAELEQAVELSPNFALGHYTLAFVHSQAGDPRAAIAASDYSRSLSPFDPLLFGMLGARAMALVRLGDFEEAAGWAVQAASRPNAHAHIHAIAAFSLALAGSMEEAEAYAAAIRKASASYGLADFFGAFRFDPQGAAAFRKGAALLGMA